MNQQGIKGSYLKNANDTVREIFMNIKFIKIFDSTVPQFEGTFMSLY